MGIPSHHKLALRQGRPHRRSLRRLYVLKAGMKLERAQMQGAAHRNNPVAESTGVAGLVEVGRLEPKLCRRWRVAVGRVSVPLCRVELEPAAACERSRLAATHSPAETVNARNGWYEASCKACRMLPVCIGSYRHERQRNAIDSYRHERKLQYQKSRSSSGDTSKTWVRYTPH